MIGGRVIADRPPCPCVDAPPGTLGGVHPGQARRMKNAPPRLALEGLGRDSGPSQALKSGQGMRWSGQFVLANPPAS